MRTEIEDDAVKFTAKQQGGDLPIEGSNLLSTEGLNMVVKRWRLPPINFELVIPSTKDESGPDTGT